MKLTFCGATRIVTGSCHLLEAWDAKVLVDCGMFQGSKDITRLNYEPFPFDPKEISHVFLTHAHIDHSGLLPKLYKHGFRGKIICTHATKDLCAIMLEDAAHMQELETRKENQRRELDDLPPRTPLYSLSDAQAVMRFFYTVNYNERYRALKNIEVRFRDAGHILGSAIVEMWAINGGGQKKIVFSGDLGQWDNPIVRDPELIDEADYVVIESTYGDRLHENIEEREALLLQYAKEAHRNGGKLLVPSFAVERTQEILYSIKKLEKTKFPKERIYLDSPLAIKATKVFSTHRECYDKEAAKNPDPFNPKNLILTQSVKDSKKINNYDMPCMVIAGSGMCTGGRIRHHLYNNAKDPRTTILFVGYQAQGTPGRKILSGDKMIKMMGKEVEINASIRKIDGFSAHADQNGLVKWATGFQKRPKKIFIVHGEPKASEALKEKLEAKGLSCKVPKMLHPEEL